MIGFNKLITPKILSVVYGLTLVAVFAAAIFCAISVGIFKAILIALMAVPIRIFFEGIMVAFKNNEYLRRIAEALEKEQAK